MTKLEFMKELESLLLDIPLEERDEALQYYNGYFEDAGVDHEDEIMKELGSPKRVATIIKADLNSNATDRENRGYFTENGYQDTSYNEEKFEIVGAISNQTGNSDHTNNDNTITNTNSTANTSTTTNTSTKTNANNTRNASNTTNENSTNHTFNTNHTNGTNYANGTNHTYNSRQEQGSGSHAGSFENGNQYNQQNNYNKNTNTGLIILLCILAIPAFPFIVSFFGIVIGIIAAILGIILGFGIAGLSMMGVGVALFIAGLIKIGIPFLGLLLCGSGLIVLGLGMLFTLASGLLCKKVLPAVVKGVVNICRLPFRNRSVIA